MRTATEIWFEKLKDIWLRKASDEIKELVSDNFSYYEDPFEAPVTDKGKLTEMWKEIEGQDIELLEIDSLVAGDSLGSARYHFVAQINGARHESKGSYFVELDKEGKAIEFRQWWNTKK